MTGIRPARPGEAAALTALALCSTAQHGYGAEGFRIARGARRIGKRRSPPPGRMLRRLVLPA